MANFQCAADMKRMDPLRLADSIRNLESQGVDELHFDVADGHFIPQYGVTAATLAAIKATTELPCHAHLLIEAPERMLPAILDTGVDIVTLHVETSVHLHRALSVIKSAGKKVGLAILPTTALTKLNYLLPLLDRLLVLGVDPVSTSTILPRGAHERVRILHENIRYHEYAIEIDVEGPLSAEDGARCLRFGAKRLVLDPTDVHGLGDDDTESLEYYRQAVDMAAHTV